MAQASVTSTLDALSTGGGATIGSAPPAPAASSKVSSGDGPGVFVPAGFIADILGGLSGAVGEVAGTYFGKPKLGKDLGEAASPLIKLLPFQVVSPPSVAPQGAEPGGGEQAAPGQDLVIVPAGFLGGLFGGMGGKLLGGAVDKWLGGGGKIGETIGGTLGGTLGGVLPFQVVPPQVTPQSAGPTADNVSDEALVVVPANFFGNLLSGVAGKFGEMVGGKTGKVIGDAASPFLKLLPFQDVPPNLAPMTTGPGGTAEEERLIMVPAGLFSSLLGGLAETVAAEVGGFLGHESAGETIGGVAKGVIEMLPFHAVPQAIAPASTTGGSGDTDKLMFVPASLFGGLLKSFSNCFPQPVGKLGSLLM